MRRLREEHHIDALHGTASLLSDLGEVIVDPIFQELGDEPSGDQALALLRALSWSSDRSGRHAREEVKAETYLVDLLQNDEPDVREAAANAMRLLPDERALRWLSHRLRSETDTDVARPSKKSWNESDPRRCEAMLLLRIGRKSRWDLDRRSDDPAHVEYAAQELALRPSDEGRLSVYRVEDEADEQEVAVRFALTCRTKPQPLDYVVFPAELAVELGLTVIPEPREDLDPSLGEGHHGITGLDEEMTRRLASATLATARCVRSILARDLDTLGTVLLRRDPRLEPYLKGKWPERLKAKPGQAEPGV